MTRYIRLSWITALILSASIGLAACESSEERAQKHYESGIALLEQGDIPRALVEFRNVFKLNPDHKEARMVFARTQMEEGARGEAYRHYLRVVEKYPDTFEARIALAEMAVDSQNWDEAERHGRAAQELAGDDPRVKIVINALDYAEAMRAENPILASKLADAAAESLKQTPDSLIALRVVIDQFIISEDYVGALAAIEAGLEFHRDDLRIQATKLQLLQRNLDMDGIGDTLKEMVELFPENTGIRQLLIAWFVEKDDLDGAEAFLRQLAAAPNADAAAKMTVVSFLLEARGPELAREEVERLIQSEEDVTIYRTLRATMDFEAGEHEKAIADMEDMVSQDASSAELLQAKVVLARMLLQSGDQVGARARIEEVVADDPTNVEALKMRAAWLIEEDTPDKAVLDLRTALAQSPRDPVIMTLMGRAHERAGSRELAGERYALAVETSMQAPAESLRYASFLVQDDRIDTAKIVLTEALEKAPGNLDLLLNLGQLHLRTETWSDATRIVWKLRALDNDRATAIANGIEADLMLKQERVDDTITFLEDLVDDGKGDSTAALAALVRTNVQAGKIDEATKLIDDRLANDPDDPALRYLRAGMHMVAGERPEAEKLYKDILSGTPGHVRIMRTLYTLMLADGRGDEAAAMIEEQIEKSSDPTTAMLLKAEWLERNKDFEGAIAIYDQLYTQNSNNILVANNLASLITTHRDTPEDIERAYAIARRFKSAEVPALQDTYGWIEYRRGDYEEALKYLEPAAKGMSDHALVQYHLGMTYVQLERAEEAKATLTKALELAGDEPLPQFENARKVLETLATE